MAVLVSFGTLYANHQSTGAPVSSTGASAGCAEAVTALAYGVRAGGAVACFALSVSSAFSASAAMSATLIFA